MLGLLGEKGGLMLKTKQRQCLKVLTFRDEPFPGILFVTALGILPVTLAPHLYYAFFAALSMNTAAKATAFFGVLWVVFMYALNVRANAIDAFIKPLNLGKCGKITCSLLIFLSDGLLLTFLSYRKRRYAALLLSVCVLIASIGALHLYLESFSWALPYFTSIGYGVFACQFDETTLLCGDSGMGRTQHADTQTLPLLQYVVLTEYAWRRNQTERLP